MGVLIGCLVERFAGFGSGGIIGFASLNISTAPDRGVIGSKLLLLLLLPILLEGVGGLGIALLGLLGLLAFNDRSVVITGACTGAADKSESSSIVVSGCDGG